MKESIIFFGILISLGTAISAMAIIGKHYKECKHDYRIEIFHNFLSTEVTYADIVDVNKSCIKYDNKFFCGSFKVIKLDHKDCDE